MGLLKDKTLLATVTVTKTFQPNTSLIANVELLLLQQFNHDFPERGSEEKQEVSQEDIVFMDSLSSTVTKTDGHYSMGLPMRNQYLVMSVKT